MKSTSIILACLLLFTSGVVAQRLNWYTPSSVEGVCIKDTAHKFHRLPAELKAQVRPIVWDLSLNTAGEFIHFRSSARSFVIRYGLAGKKEMPHMPATGVSGLDLYVKSDDGQLNWVPANFKFGDTCVYTYGRKIGVEAGASADFYLFLPLYNTVTWLEIGIQKEEELTFLADQRGKPIVAYGTSIMHGAVASRPGMNWTNILGRRLDKMVINLGFSGNGKYEKPIFDLMARVDAELYILDCMPNLTGEARREPEELEKRIRYGVATLQNAHPNAPIVFAEYPDGDIGFYADTTLMNARHAANLFMARVFGKLKAEGIGNIYLLKEKDFGFTEYSLTEATHPNDIGMLQYAQAYEKIIRQILRTAE